MGLSGHEKIVNAALAFMARATGKTDVIDIGGDLLSMGADELTNGGFWILDVKNQIEFYSPRFRNGLGFKNEEDFPSVPESWQGQIYPESLERALVAYKECLDDRDAKYHLPVKYYKKDRSETVELLCSGHFIWDNGEVVIVIGTHIIWTQ